jgi:hypothetical protein
MKEYKELYLPLFYNWVEFTEELSDEEFGILIRALLLNARENAVPENLDAKIKIVYKFMLDSAKRAHESQKNLAQKRSESSNKRWHPSDANECKDMQTDANECKRMQSYAINGNINENINENGNENVNVNVNENVNGNNYKRSRAKGQIKEQYGNFDTDYAFRKALERTYANLDDDDD